VVEGSICGASGLTFSLVFDAIQRSERVGSHLDMEEEKVEESLALNRPGLLEVTYFTLRPASMYIFDTCINARSALKRCLQNVGKVRPQH